MKVTTLNRSPSQNRLERSPRKALYPGAIPVVAFIIVATLAFFGVRQEGTLGVTGTQCGAGWCITSVYPASNAWTEGVRVGDLVISVDGTLTATAPPSTYWRDARSILVSGKGGAEIAVEVVKPVIGESALKFSMWIVAGFFAILGTLIWYRRPDLTSAAGLGRMATTASIALAIAPAAAGPQLEWALAIQFTALAILGFTFFDFVFHMAGEHSPHRKATIYLRWILGSLTIVNLLGYPVAVFITSDVYEFLLPLVATTLASSLLASVYVLLVAVVKAPGGSEEDRLRVPLLGMLLGAAPFPLATLVPLALGNDPLAPHLTVLPVILIPSAFAYSILHDQLWGIRRLIHRSLVYGLVSAMVLTIVVGGIALSQRLLNSSGGSTGDVIAVSIVAFIGISAYAPLRRSVRWVVDRAMYGMTPSYPEFVQGLQRDLASADPDSELPETLSRVLAEHLDLESAILFKHDNEDGQTEVVASVGSGTERVLEALRERRIAIPTNQQDDRPTVIPFEGEQILRMQLWAAQQHVGTLFLGPKNGGELFIQEEVMLVMNAAPFMAAAIERHEMSQTMRQLARRLVDMDEYSRQRMAVDLHDGPLQKAVALAIGRVSDPRGSERSRLSSSTNCENSVHGYAPRSWTTSVYRRLSNGSSNTTCAELRSKARSRSKEWTRITDSTLPSNSRCSA